MRVPDARNTGLAGRLPGNELARRVEGLSGEVEMRWEVAPGSALGTRSPWARQTDRGPLLEVDSLTIAVRGDGVGDPVVGERDVTGSFVVREASAWCWRSRRAPASRCTCPCRRRRAAASTARCARGRRGRSLGNLPQALSHLARVNTAMALQETDADRQGTRSSGAGVARPDDLRAEGWS